MPAKISLRRSFLMTWVCLSLFLALSPVSGQVPDWKDRVAQTFVFEITNREAENLFRSNPRDSLIKKMLHTPVTQFEGYWENRPEQGHFIFARIVQNSVECEYVPVMPFQVFLYSEYGVLTLQVVDAQGEIRRDAKVRIRRGWRLFNTPVTFDPESQTYRIDDTSDREKRLLTVELDGFRAIFDLTKHIIRPSWYGGGSEPYIPDFYSYMLTDKNRYKPGETIRFKSYALTGSRRPLRTKLEVWLETDNRKYRKISTLEPYNPGGYAGQVVLHDSLGLKLDRHYSIQLREARGRIVARQRFRYEDYVLYDNTLEVKLDTDVHYHPETNRIKISATDANGLFLPDVRADVAVLRRSVNRSYAEILTLPDTLLHERITLKNDGPTTLDIPASVFGEADGSYEVLATVVTFDGQKMEAGDAALFFRSHRQVEATTRGDTIRFDYLVMGKPTESGAELFYDGDGNGRRVTLPHEEPFDQNRREYRLRIGGSDFEQRIATRNIDPGLGLEGGFVRDSFNIRGINPLALELSWYIYRGNALTGKGAGKEIEFKLPETDLNSVHYVEIFYFMGGEEQVFRRTFVPRTEFLSVEADLPGRVFPGQSVEATVRVRDHLGNPVRGADLTAMAWNSLLDYDVPDLPYYGEQPQGREQRSSYSVDRKGWRFTMPLDYKFWRGMARLDTLEYYRLAYPDGLYRHESPTPDGITQYAPYIMKEGAAVALYVIEDNGRPVYFSWTGQPQGYSFPVDSEKRHTLTLRLHDRALVIDSLSFAPGVKTTLSLDLDRLPKGVRTIRLNNKDRHGNFIFTSTETERYSALIARFPVYNTSQVKQFRRGTDDYLTIFHPMFSAPYGQSILAGPIPPGQASYDGSVTYRHEGGFRYAFEDNVVYKYPENVTPEALRFYSQSKIGTLGDLYLSPVVMAQKERETEWRRHYWQPSNIYIAQQKLNLNIRLPERKDSVGVANLIFIDHAGDRVIHPDRYEKGRRVYSEIAPGRYDIVLLYNDAGYLRRDGVEFRAHTYIEVDATGWPRHRADTLSEGWYKRYGPPGMIGVYHTPKSDIRTMTLYQRTGGLPGNTVSGFVYDTEGEPLLGATVQLKGTRYGTVTDTEGYFEVDIAGDEHRTLAVSYLGFTTKELAVWPGSVIQVVLEADMMALDEVVVIGYGTTKRMAMTGSVAGIMVQNAGSVSGDVLPPQAPPEDLDDNGQHTEDAEAEERIYRELLTIGGLRSNFSDVGFWEPALVTDRWGEASFNVTFPDNITKWNAVVYAMNRRLQTGTWRRSIRSYKPLMAELRMPQFLVAGDVSRFAANIRNYTSDTAIEGEAFFMLNADTLIRRPVTLASSHTERLEITAPAADSLTAWYLFTRNDGYSDGEQRSIAILPVGTAVAEGTLGFLRDGERIDLEAAENESIEVVVTGNQLDVYLDAANYLRGYRYACNEQLASKLTGLLTLRLWELYNGERFRHDRAVNDLVRRLLDNRNDRGLWSWWGRSPGSSHWMSAHILRALAMARDQGYTVNLNLNGMLDNYMDMGSYRKRSIEDIEILHALSGWGVEQPYGPAVEYWEGEICRLERQADSVARRNRTKRTTSWLPEKLMLWEIRQREGLGFSPDSVARYLKKDVLGAVYCDDNLERSWWKDPLATTLAAYRIVRADSTLVHHREAMQMYILGTRQQGWNTYRSADAVATIFPDLLETASSGPAAATLLLTGKENRTVTTFPYRTKLEAGERLGIEKQDGIPLIWSAWSTKLYTEARTGEAFDIETNLSNDGRFRVGEVETLTVTVRVKQSGAEHVMIEVPIPAGCDYASKPQSWRGPEVHREYFKERTVIFCERMPRGEYTFHIDLLPRYGGRYTVNPAKVELMYFPVVSSNNDLNRMEIE